MLAIALQAQARDTPPADGAPPPSAATPAPETPQPDSPPSTEGEGGAAPAEPDEGSGGAPPEGAIEPEEPSPGVAPAPAAVDPEPDEDQRDEPPPTDSTAELLAADDIGIGPGYGEGVAALPAEDQEEDDGRPWGQGILVPGVGFGLGFGADATVLSFSLGAMYYFVDGFAAGLSIGDTIFFYSDELDRDFPGFSDEIPTNIFRITPRAQYVFYRNEHFSPYVSAGVGPVFFNHGGGVVGEWIAGPGLYIGIAGPVALDLGVAFSSIFPEDAWEEAFSYQGQRVVACSITESLCSFDITPRIGVVLSF